MAPHKKAGHSIRVVSDLPTGQLAQLCKEAAEQSKVALDAEETGRLAFSVRGLVMSSKNRLLDFEVRLSTSQDKQIVTSHILNYRTIQSTVLFIPVGAKRMTGYPVYAKFMQRLGELVEHLDAGAEVVVVE